MELPLCRWRGGQLVGERWQCGSPKLIVPSSGVSAEQCTECYCRDHPPLTSRVRRHTCPHLGKRIRSANGEVKRVKCAECGGLMLDVHQCEHPGIGQEVTLANCTKCLYSPARPATVFERVYLVNLRSRADRLISFRRRQETHGWGLGEVTVLQALEGDKIGVPSYFREGGGAWGCLRSHCRILEECIMADVQSVLVLEDDAEWFADAWDRLALFMQAVPADWSQLMLGGQQMRPPTPLGNGVMRVLNCQRTHAYAIRGAAMKSLLRVWYSAAVHLDWVMGGDWQRNWPVYSPEEFIFGQSGGKSDISGRLNNALYWNPPTNALVVHLQAPAGVAAALRGYGLHMGFRRNDDGVDTGLASVVAGGATTEALAKWLSTICWEVASMEGRAACVWHPDIAGELVERAHGGPVRRVQAETLAEALDQLEDLNLTRCLSATHVLLLSAPREVVESLPGFHRGYWIDPDTGRDKGLDEAVAGDVVAGLRKWLKHTGEEAERMQQIPVVWHPAIGWSAVWQAFPTRQVVELSADTVEAVEQGWAANVQ